MFGGNNDDPFRDIESFFRRMSQLGGGMFTPGGSGLSSSSFSRTVGSGGSFESSARGSFAPATTISDTGKQFLIELDVPGVPKEELKVTATGQKVCITGHRRPSTNITNFGNSDFFGFQHQQQSQQQADQKQQLPDQKQQGGNNNYQVLFMDERPVGYFERCFTFPSKIDEQNISAQFNNGVLSVAVGHSGSDDKSKEISIR